MTAEDFRRANAYTDEEWQVRVDSLIARIVNLERQRAVQRDRLAAAERVLTQIAEQADYALSNPDASWGHGMREILRLATEKAYSSQPVPLFCTNCGEPAPTGPTTTNERAHCPKCGGESWAGTYDLNFSGSCPVCGVSEGPCVDITVTVTGASTPTYLEKPHPGRSPDARSSEPLRGEK